MYLSREEERMLVGEEGEAVRKSMEILVALGDAYGAERLIPVRSAQVSGVSYKTIGDAGLEYLEDLSADAKVRIRTTLNPPGMDMEQWRELYVPEDFAAKQMRILDAYGRMGIELSCTCTPYLAGNRPALGEHLAWAESSAVSFANSVLGARTNREGGPSALAAAITGRTPEFGLHLDENRKATVIIDVDFEPDYFDYALLGVVAGRIAGGGVPYFRGMKTPPSEDSLKSLGAAMAASGSVALYHVEGVTPEYSSALPDGSGLERHTVDKNMLESERERMSTARDIELVTVGCPHSSAEELRNIAAFLKGRKRRGNTELWVYTSRFVRETEKEAVKVIEQYGKVVADTCMVVSPLEVRFHSVGTNSGKAASYLPGLCRQDVLFADLKTLLGMVVE